MAGIDKTYVNNYKDYKDLLNWAKENRFKCPGNNTIIDISKYIYKLTDTNLSFPVPVLNTPQVVDYFLIKYCPLKFIQNRMKDVYKDFYDSVKKGISEFDTYQKNEISSKFKIRISPVIKLNTGFFDISIYRNEIDKETKEVYCMPFYYNEEYDIWLDTYELGEYTDIYCSNVKTIKSIKRKLISWKLPKGCFIKVNNLSSNWLFEMI